MFSIRHRYIFIALASAYTFGNILLAGGDRPVTRLVPDGILFISLSIQILVMWEFNHGIQWAQRTSARLSGNDVHPLFFLFGFSHLGVVASALVTLFFLTNILNTPVTWSADHLKPLLAFGLRTNFLLNCMNGIYFYADRLRSTEVEATELRRINIQAQFEALKAQISPHMLMNSLNALSMLVYKNPDTAATFVSQLAKVYRYLLFHQEKKAVTLRDEMEFMESYHYLLRMRFGESIEITTRVEQADLSLEVAPASLQMLVENAIKHNIVSLKNKLHIEILSENQSITVVNNLQEKLTREPSTHIGLNNIIRRYSFLTDRQVVIEKTEKEFRVTLPLIKTE